MSNNIPKEHIANIAKASTYFIFRNGPMKELHKHGKLSDEEVKSIQTYMQNHLAYLYNVLLEESNLNKFELIVNTMNKFYVNDDEKVILDGDGFDNFYNQLFPQASNISFTKE
ncbi:hypothetical protein [Clostridium tarantellae]|uniref:Uncharacterized protein n=1 Tax=Clostridium tarantellae TaxID=39493 RepID=A0A6I1MJV8_9CLOT|nr:hypothetical protein [Clostridium tarantellae]MPQ42993.1 hypothetical protein [Clostridium tarantellae]